MKTNINPIQNSKDNIQIVGFILNNEEYGLDIRCVKEINILTKITRIPNAPEFVEGIVNLRGTLIPLIELRSRFGLQKKEHDKNTRIVVVENGEKSAGIIVDSVSKVMRIEPQSAEMPPKITSGINSSFIKSIIKLDNELLILLDIKNLLSGSEKEELEEALKN